MNIKFLNLISFGRFKNKHIELSPGLNIICGKNESGKTTTMAFIKAMLYSVSGRGLSNERTRYFPWDADIMEGEMTVEQNKRRYLIHRKWGRTAAGDRYTLSDGDTGEKTDTSPESFIGVGEEAFLKTLYIKQTQTAISGEDDEISGKLINLMHSGDEEENYHGAIEILRDAMRKYRAFRGNGGQIYELENKITTLNGELVEAKEINRIKLSAASRQRALKGEIKEAGEALKLVSQKLDKTKENIKQQQIFDFHERIKLLKDQVGKAAHEEKSLSDQLFRMSAFARDAKDIIYEKSADISDASLNLMQNRKKENLYKKLLLVSAIIGAILSVLVFLNLYLAPAAAATIIVTVFFKISEKKSAKIVSKVENIIKSTEEKQAEIERELDAFGCKSLREYTEKRSEYTGLLQRHQAANERLITLKSELEKAEKELGTTVDYVGERPIAEDIDLLERELNSKSQNLMALQREEAEISGRLSAVAQNMRAADIIQGEIITATEQLRDAKKRHNALSVALETLEESYAEISRDFTPALNERASKIMAQITGGDHRSMKIDRKYGVKMESGAFRELTYFSHGTMDQAYLAVRLALIDLIFPENPPPVFIDDSFVQYDEYRLKNVTKMLLKRAKYGQVIVFSCRVPVETEGANIIHLA